MKSAIELILEERTRQVEVEGFLPQYDDKYTVNQLAKAAACYAIPFDSRPWRGRQPAPYWPWAPKWWKPTPDDRLRELTKAGALILAEMERLQRKEQHST